MPWTSVDFEINRDTGLMMPKRTQDMTYVSSVKGLEEATGALVRGGKFHKIYLESFGMHLFPKILENIAKFSGGGYVPHNLSMDITQYHMTGYNWGNYGDTVLSLSHCDTTGDSVLNLNIGGSNTPDEQRRELTEWFSGLS